VSDIKPGDRVRIRDAYGHWRDATALSGEEDTHDIDPKTGNPRKIHDFPVVWVRTRPGGDPVPWPAEDVQPAEPAGGEPDG
jgi:hypothetical protein